MTTSDRSKLYRALLLLFPTDFRQAFGPDMEQLFADRRREVSARGRGFGRLWGEAVVDVAVQGAREWSARFGKVASEVIEEGMRMDGWLRDLNFGARTLARRPGFTVAAVATLALGIGATVSIFSVVNGVLLKPLPFPEPHQLVKIWNVDVERGSRSGTIEHPVVRAWQEAIPGLQVAGYSATRPTLTGLGRPEVLSGVRVTDGLLTLIGYEPRMGRDLVAADDVDGGPRIAVVSHGLWTDRLGRDPDVLGRTILLGGNAWEIVGVAPEDFDFPRGTEVWLPRRHELDGCGHGCRIIQAIGRLDADVTLDEVQARLDAVSERFALEYPDSHRDSMTELEPMLDSEVAGVSAGLWILFGAVGMVLLIACANVANLMLVRASQRREEVALRIALGASRTRIVRQLLTESLIISALAGAVGLALSTWGTRALVSMAPDTLPRLSDIGIEPMVFAFTGVLVVVVTSLFGLFPATQLSRQGLSGAMSSSRRAGRRGAGFSRSVLIAGEVGLSLALLLGAGLLFRTLVEIRNVDFGFVVEDSERFRMSIPGSRYDSLEIGRFLGTVEDRLDALPQIAAVGSGFGVPLGSGNIWTSIRLLDRAAMDPADLPAMAIRPSSPGFLRASGTSLVAGRWFTEDDVYGSQPVAVINQAAARLHYADVDPIGRTIGADVSWSFAETPPLTIVGIVEDVRASATDEPEAALYLPNTQFGANSVFVWVRLAPGVATAMPAIRNVLQELDPELAITSVTTMESLVAEDRHTPRFYLTLLTVFSVLALALAAIGLYGVVAYSVSQRTREIGIRIALGAHSDRVVGMVVRQSVRPVVAGIVLGLGLSLAGGRVLEGLLFGVAPNDPLTVVLTSVVLIAVAAGATLLPAARASRIPAASALRAE